MSRILIVEDDPAIAIALEDDLRLEGYSVEVVRDGEAASGRAKQTLFDLILLDVQMPMVSGGEVCRILKSREETARVPILFCSDLEESELEALTAEAGADGFVRKTRPMPELIAEIKKRLS